jgi:UDP-N-acetylglucosamine 2-epimerase (non-hydrolysing)
MKVMTVLGTRPEIIRLSLIIPKLDQNCDHVLVHTGQNYDPNLNEIFFRDLGVREPDHYLGIEGRSFGDQIGRIISRSEEVMAQEEPDRLLILGDTNSGLAALIAKRMSIPVFHMEAGNRCYDDRVPEEVNRRIIDHSSDILMPYTERSRANLLREGIAGHHIYVTGNPIFEVIQHYRSKVEESDILDRLGVAPGAYFLVTVHRAENVDDEGRLGSILDALQQISRKYKQPVICSLHPRTRDRMERMGLSTAMDGVHFHEPFGFFDFVRLEQHAGCVLSDSGTVQEECCIFSVPNVTIRDVTERPETVECGSNMLSGAEAGKILLGVDYLLSGQDPAGWIPPPEYLRPSVSATVMKIILGYHHSIVCDKNYSR